jgi:hypothetical protein
LREGGEGGGGVECIKIGCDGGGGCKMKSEEGGYKNEEGGATMRKIQKEGHKEVIKEGRNKGGMGEREREAGRKNK